MAHHEQLSVLRLFEEDVRRRTRERDDVDRYLAERRRPGDDGLEHVAGDVTLSSTTSSIVGSAATPYDAAEYSGDR